MSDIKPLTIKETSLKEEMKSRCLNKGQYTDKNAKEKFKMLCHLEDFEIGYWALQQERDKYKSIVEELKKWLEEEIKQYDNVGLKFKKQGNFECASRSYDYLKQYQTMLSKIKELEEGK